MKYESHVYITSLMLITYLATNNASRFFTSLLRSHLSGCHETGEHCVTSRKTAAKETISSPVNSNQIGCFLISYQTPRGVLFLGKVKDTYCTKLTWTQNPKELLPFQLMESSVSTPSRSIQLINKYTMLKNFPE